MSWGDTRTWRYLGSGEVKEYGDIRRISLPERVFEVGLLRNPDEVDADQEGVDPVRAYWSIDTATQWLVLSNERLENDPEPIDGTARAVRYTSGRNMVTKPGDERDDYRATVPSQFFEASEGGQAAVSDQVTDEVRVEPGEQRHFVTADAFLSDQPTPTKSCYVLSRHELETLFRDSEVEPDGPHTTIPRFLS